MGLLDRLFGRGSAERFYWLHVRCNKCGATIRVRVDLFNDLSIADEGGYILRKEIVDDSCHQLMRAELRFDDRRRVTSRQVSGGNLITKEEYDASEKH